MKLNERKKATILRDNGKIVTRIHSKDQKDTRQVGN